ncbi:MAG: DUF1566 domain-containing protein [bacterium]
MAAALVLGATLGTSPALAQAGKTLNTCQTTVAAASTKYVRQVADSVGKCLSAVSTAVIKKGKTTAEAADGAASACVAALRKIRNTDDPTKTLAATLDAELGAQCDPAINPSLQHVETDTYTVGATTLGAANLNEYCARFGGDGTIDSFAEWRTCLHAAADNEARETITVRWPRVLEYFEALLAEISTLPASSRVSDAQAALIELDAAIEGPVEDNVADAPSSTPGLLATGATACLLPYEGFVPCPRGFPNQDGGVRAGFAAQHRDNHDGTITDAVSGLTWEKLSDDGSIHHRLDAYSFSDAFTVKIAALNAGGGFAGHTDWRLPNRRELESLVDAGYVDPIVRPIFNHDCSAACSVLECSCTEADEYWTSTSYQADASTQWVVEFLGGQVRPNTAATARVRAVRGGTTAASAPPDPPSAGATASLSTCQKSVASQSRKYIGTVTNAVGKCLNAISTAVIKKGATTTDAAHKAAPSCAAALRKLVNTEKPTKELSQRFTADLAAKCDPAVNTGLSHLDADTYTIGTTTLSAAKLADYCVQFGGDGRIDSFAEWSQCLRQMADAEAQQAIALRWPRALEYFAALQTEIAALPASGKQADALVALAALDSDIEGETDDNKPEPRSGPAAGLLVTGQTQCAQGDSSMGACPGGLSGQDGELRVGITRSYTDNGDGTISDNVTGLMWEKESDDDSIHDRDHEYVIWGAYLNKIPRLNRNSFAGYSDWRLPNRRELESLVDAGRALPAIDPIFDNNCTPGCTVLECSCTSDKYYWTSSMYHSSTPGWYVDFQYGSVQSSPSTSFPRVRAVRGGNKHPIPYVNQAPIAKDININHPWKSSCVPVTFIATDSDSAILYVRLVSFPQQGYLSDFVSAQIPASLPDQPKAWGPTDADWDWDMSLIPIGWTKTTCYVTFSTTFTGTDSFTYEVVDSDGNVSNGATATITVFEID